IPGTIRVAVVTLAEFVNYRDAWPIRCNENSGRFAVVIPTAIKSRCGTGRRLSSNSGGDENETAQHQCSHFSPCPTTITIRFHIMCLVCGECVPLNNALVEHGVGHLDESGDVRAHHEIAGLTILFGSFPGI